MDALRLSQMALRAFAAVYGTLGILCVCASFVAPRAALYAILNLGTATAIAGKKRRSDRKKPAAPGGRRKARRAHTGGGRGGRCCKALFRRQGDRFFQVQA